SRLFAEGAERQFRGMGPGEPAVERDCVRLPNLRISRVYFSGSTRMLRHGHWLDMASSVPNPEDTRFADRRAYPRVEVALPAFLQAEGERHAVQLIDLSAGGAKLDCPLSLPTGTAV